LIDEVAVFNYALSPGQILALYQSGTRLPQIQLNLVSTNSAWNVLWPQGTLLQAASAAGPWLPVPGALSPWMIFSTNSAAFYRVLVHQ